MARKNKGFIELEWTCPNCDTRNRGSSKTCTNCGAPQPEDVQFEAPTEGKFVSEEKAGELRKRGADIHCGFCGTRNPSDATTCSQCGGDLSEGVARKSGREIKSPSGPQTVICKNCGTENPAAKVNCTECGSPLPRLGRSGDTAQASEIKAGSGSSSTSVQSAKKKPNWLVLGGIAAGLLICCLAVIFLFALPSQSVQATVRDVYWETSVPVQEVQKVRHTNERGNSPSAAFDLSCSTESQEVCEEKTVDRGDGFAEVVEECHTESEQYCDYTVDEWTTIQTFTLNGHDVNPVYSQPNLSTGQRLGDSSAEFTVNFDTNEGEKSYSPSNTTEFQQFQIGSTWTIRMNALGGVVDVER